MLDEGLPRVAYTKRARSEAVAELQRTLNRFPGSFVKVNSIPGNRTSGAFRRLSVARQEPL